MPLSNEVNFGVRPLTDAINNLPVTPTTIRESGLFVPEYLTTTYVDVESKGNQLTLVQSAPVARLVSLLQKAVRAKRPFSACIYPKMTWYVLMTYKTCVPLARKILPLRSMTRSMTNWLA